MAPGQTTCPEIAQTGSVHENRIVKKNYAFPRKDAQSGSRGQVGSAECRAAPRPKPACQFRLADEPSGFQIVGKLLKQSMMLAEDVLRILHCAIKTVLKPDPCR